MASHTLPLVALIASACSRGSAPPRTAHVEPAVRVRLVGGPTAVIEIGGVRFLTDPTFSPAGAYEVVPGRTLTKLEGPALTPADIGPVDAVLLSHDQHVDNLDPAGRAFVESAPVTFSTPLAASRLHGHLVGLTPWQRVDFTGRDGRLFHITAVPAQHGPDATEQITGPVTGFLVASDGLPTVYVSGDNASIDVVREIAARTQIDVALLFVGAARSPRLLGQALLTLDAAGAVDAAGLLADAQIVPVHFRGWGHFTESGDQLRAAFTARGLADRMHLLAPGEDVSLHAEVSR